MFKILIFIDLILYQSNNQKLIKMKKIQIFILVLLCTIQYSYAQEDKPEVSNEDIAKASQNPLSALISIPVQNNIYMGIGPDNQTKNVANIQPVIPVGLGEKVDLILRMILPVITVPTFLNHDTSATGSTTGLGDMTLTGFFSPHKVRKKLIWGAGAAIYFPTATSSAMPFTKKWGAGPSVVMMLPMGKFNMGFLLMNIWSFAGPDTYVDKINFFQFQPWVNYNISNGWFVSSVPIITNNWNVPDGKGWTVPLGAGAGKAFKLGKLPVSAQFHAYYNVISPDVIGEKWQMRIQAQFFLPRKKK